MAVLWSCQRVVRCMTVFACFTYLLTTYQGDWFSVDWDDPLASTLKRRYRVWSGMEMGTFGARRRSGVPAIVVVDAQGEEVAFLPAEREGASTLARFSREWRRWPEEL